MYDPHDRIQLIIPASIDVDALTLLTGRTLRTRERIALIIDYFRAQVTKDHTDDDGFFPLSNLKLRIMCRVPEPIMLLLEQRGVIESKRTNRGNKSYFAQRGKEPGRSARYRLAAPHYGPVVHYTLTDPDAIRAYQRLVMVEYSKTRPTPPDFILRSAGVSSAVRDISEDKIKREYINVKSISNRDDARPSEDEVRRVNGHGDPSGIVNLQPAFFLDPQPMPHVPIKSNETESRTASERHSAFPAIKCESGESRTALGRQFDSFDAAWDAFCAEQISESDMALWAQRFPRPAHDPFG